MIVVCICYHVLSRPTICIYFYFIFSLSLLIIIIIFSLFKILPIFFTITPHHTDPFLPQFFCIYTFRQDCNDESCYIAGREELEGYIPKHNSSNLCNEPFSQYIYIIPIVSFSFISSPIFYFFLHLLFIFLFLFFLLSFFFFLTYSQSWNIIHMYTFSFIWIYQHHERLKDIYSH